MLRARWQKLFLSSTDGKAVPNRLVGVAIFHVDDFLSSTDGKAVPKANPHGTWPEESAAALLERDPLVARALEVLAAAPQSAEEAAERQLYEELLASSYFEVGTWGQAPFASAAERALRLQRVSVGGDELDWDAVAGAG